jgi:anti-anti-sigma factor
MQSNTSGSGFGECAETDALTPSGRLTRLKIQLTADSRGITVGLAGELDLETAPELDRRLVEIDATKHGRLLIDLRAVEFMDSTGLASIIRAQRDANSNGHDLALRRGSGQVQRLFELTGFGDRVTFED